MTTLEYGSTYTVCGNDALHLRAWHNGESWWLADEWSRTTYIVKGNALIACDFFGNESGPSVLTLDDLLFESRGDSWRIDTYIDDTARQLLDAVDM